MQLVLSSLIALFLGASPAIASERIQHFKGIEVTQTSEPGCAGLKIKYQGRLSSESDLQVFVDLNGVRGIFGMVRKGESYELDASSCPRSSELRKLFYSAMTNGHPSAWFVQLAFLGDSPQARDTYGFYFP